MRKTLAPLFIFPFLGLLSAQEPAADILLLLRSQAPVERALVTIGDVAHISGGDIQLRDSLARLDLAELSPQHMETFISRNHVGIRLQLAGIDARAVKIDGADRVRVWLGGDIRLASTTGKVYQTVAVTRRRVDTGEQLSADNLTFERRLVDAGSSPARLELPVQGARARRIFLGGHVLLQGDVEFGPGPSPGTAPGTGAVVIKNRDPVTLVALVGGLKITTKGEAMQDGAQGQRIRVKNVDSKRVVEGRVVDAATIEVGN